jgi:hypothetical protein
MVRSSQLDHGINKGEVELEKILKKIGKLYWCGIVVFDVKWSYGLVVFGRMMFAGIVGLIVDDAMP